MTLQIDQDILLCPNCGDQYLHHDKVEIFEREEDEANGIHVVVAKKSATIDTLLEGNPSSRRHGINIHFFCEDCNGRFVLSISQHKGLTIVDFKEEEPNEQTE